jgi:hypothetical protein
MNGNPDGLRSLARNSKLPIERIRYFPDADESVVHGALALNQLPEFRGRVSGAGETAWVRNGTIIVTSGLGLNIECFEPNTLSLLTMP